MSKGEMTPKLRRIFKKVDCNGQRRKTKSDARPYVSRLCCDCVGVCKYQVVVEKQTVGSCMRREDLKDGQRETREVKLVSLRIHPLVGRC